MGGSSTEMKEPKFENWVYFEQIIVKSTQFGQNWVLFYLKWYTNGWVIGRKNWYRESQVFEVRQAHPRTILTKVTTPPGPKVPFAITRHKLSMLEIPLDKELCANCLVETRTKLEKLIPATMVE